LAARAGLQSSAHLVRDLFVVWTTSQVAAVCGFVSTAKTTTAATLARMARILVVEDDRFMREVLGEQLIAAGHTPSLFDDPIAGINALLKSDFDLVISDMNLPYLHGIDFMKAVLGDPKTAHIPVLLVTGAAANKTWLDALEAGAAGYLTKPVRAEELAREIDRALSAARED
jgi:CheY-like chemotaxis protein